MTTDNVIHVDFGGGLPPLREYQRRGVADIRETAKRLARDIGPCGVLAVAPTGAGKTRIGLELALAAIAKGGRALWLAPRNELVEQPVRRMRAMGFQGIRTIYDGRDEGDPGAPLIVASIQTLVARNLKPPADVVVNDEARHYVVNGPWGELAGAYRDTFRVGLDATPCRGDGLPLKDLFDEIVPISSTRELTELGYLVPARIIGPAEFKKSLSATALESYEADARGKRALVFCASKGEAHATAARFSAAGWASEAVDADTPRDVRRAALDRVRSGETLVLVNCMLYTEGLDLVELEAIIIARGIGGPHMWIQIGGRGLRPSPRTGKTECIISDLMGHFHRPNFGPLDDPRRWSLEGKPITTDDGLPGAVQCKECHGWFRAGGSCPSCGAVLPRPKKPPMSRRARAELRRAAALKKRQGVRWEFYRKLVQTQRAQGYKPGWVALTFKGKFKRYPPWRVDDVPEDDRSPFRSTVREELQGDRPRAEDARGSRCSPFRAQQSPLFPEDS